MYDVEAQSNDTTNLFTSLFESKEESGEGRTLLDAWAVRLQINQLRQLDLL